MRTNMVLVLSITTLGIAFGGEPDGDAAKRHERCASVLRDLKSADADIRATANRALQALEVATLVQLRAELRSADSGEQRKLLAKRLDALKEKTWEANTPRVEAWLKAGRWDLANEILSTSPGKDPTPILQPLMKERSRLSVAFDRCLAAVADPARPPLIVSVEYPPDPVWLAKRRSSDDPITEMKGVATDTLDNWVLRAEVCRLSYKFRNGCFLAVRSRLADALPENDISEWHRSNLFVNNGFTAREVYESLVICDGDFTLNGRLHGVYSSLIICNGDFVADVTVTPQSVMGSVIYATGDIKFPIKVKKPSGSIFFAGGKVHDAKAVADAKHIHEGVTEPPFNVRFLDPKEFGLTLEVAKGGLTVAKLDEKSAFAKQGLKAGDLITHADDLPMKTVADFRRELRRGVIDGGLLVRVERDGKTIPMLFEVPDAPKPAKK